MTSITNSTKSKNKDNKDNKEKPKKHNFMKRLLKDCIDIYKNPLEDNGIYYIHDETNIKKGYAMIIGPGDTIYKYGAYLFEFEFPNDYPFSPPKLKYTTNNGNIRFNPNLYRNGKVCVSILNTWRGEQWTSCQTIRSVLLSLITLLHNEPLLNEPGITKKHKDYDNYNNLIEFFNYKTAIIGIIENNMRSINNEIIRKKLLNIYINFINTKKNNILENIKKLRNKWDNDTDSFIMKINNKKIKHFRFRCQVYSMTTSVSYELLEIQFNTYFNKKNKNKN
tara:strand:+ start:883 stop:1719 length:837 start_codon:yes stop_codon:yes gene_type:complete